MFRRNIWLTLMAVLLAASFVSAQSPGDVGSVECALVQQAAQMAAGDEADQRNHGQWVRLAARVVSAAREAGQISAECASCIMNQFARSIPVGEQELCGPPVFARDLVGPEENACDGPAVGTTIVADLGPAGLDVRVNFTNGPPSTTFNVFWVCTDVPNGCHADACGFVNLGQVSTDAAGLGSFQTILAGGNPYPGSFVHFDVCVPFCSGPLFTSTYDNVFPVSVGPTLVAPIPLTADPTQSQ